MNNSDGNSNERPVGKPKRQSAAVYRRRRLAVAFLLLVVVVLSFIIVSALAGIFSNAKGSSTASDDGATGPAAQVAEERQERTAQKSAEACDKDKMIVTVRSDASTYPEGRHPRFGVSVENKNPGECDINLGTKTMNYSILQGGSEVFSSQHCAVKDLTDWPRRLASGATVTVEDFTWQRTFTQKGCPEPSTKINQALPGNYSLTVNIGSYRSKPLDFVLK